MEFPEHLQRFKNEFKLTYYYLNTIDKIYVFRCYLQIAICGVESNRTSSRTFSDDGLRRSVTDRTVATYRLIVRSLLKHVAIHVLVENK